MKRLCLFMAVAALLALGGCKKKDEGGGGATETAGGDKAGGDKAGGDKAGGDKAGGDKAGGDKTGGDSSDDPKVKRGEYLAKLAGCQFCHTPFGPKGPDMSKTWAGGLEIPEVFGTWRSPNITQHKETGIGGWTDDQIKVAIREGKRPDGSQLYLIMPYLYYNRLSNDDADALVAYLRTIKPIENKVEPSDELKLPKIPAPPPNGDPAPDKKDAVKHGGYLATVMHCGHCHTPMKDNKGGGVDMSKAFAGGFKFELPMFGEGALYSSNLTPHETGIKDSTDEQIINAMRMMKKKDGSMIQGPMALYQGSWFDLPDDDAKAIVAFLRSLPPIDNKVPASTFKPKGPPPK